jgi:putative polyhydroxyalkanoate system protein
LIPPWRFFERVAARFCLGFAAESIAPPCFRAATVSLYWRSRFQARAAVSKITIKRRHGLDHKKAKSAAEKMARDLKARFDLDYAWEGDHIAFERPGLTGTLQVGKTDVRLDVELSFLLSALKGPIEQAIHRELDTLFKKA